MRLMRCLKPNVFWQNVACDVAGSSQIFRRKVQPGERFNFSRCAAALRSASIPFLLIGGVSHASEPEDLSKLLDSGQYEAAYVRAVSQLADREGDPAFDFAYAQAALRTGRYQEAVFALERVTTLEPDHHAARMALGDAYAGLGNQREASKWYRSLLDHPEIGDQAAEALARVDTPFDLLGRKLRLWVDFSGGFDSNVNLGSDEDGLWIDAPPSPAFFYAFPDSFQAQSARFHETRLGADFIHQTGSGKALDAYLAAGKKQNLGEDQFDQTQYALNTGYRFQAGNHAIRLAARYLQDDLNDKRLRYTWGITGEARTLRQQTGIAGWERSLLLGVSRIEYPQQRDRSADQTLIGISGNRDWGPIRHRLRLFLGDEDVNGAADYLGRRFANIGWHAEFLGMPRYADWLRAHLGPVTGSLTPLIYSSAPFIEFGFTQSRNRGELPGVRERRLDRIFELKTGARTRIGRNLELRVELEARRADSNIEIYEYQRNLIRVGVRYDLL